MRIYIFFFGGGGFIGKRDQKNEIKICVLIITIAQFFGNLCRQFCPKRNKKLQFIKVKNGV